MALVINFFSIGISGRFPLLSSGCNCIAETSGYLADFADSASELSSPLPYDLALLVRLTQVP